jgi:hypothetical protein
MAGYNEKLTVVDKIREDYLRKHSEISPQSTYSVPSVPLEYINAVLQAMNEPWRARIFDDQLDEALAAAQAVTFEGCAKKYIKAHRSGWKSEKHADQWTSTQETWAYSPSSGGFNNLIGSLSTLGNFSRLGTCTHKPRAADQGAYEVRYAPSSGAIADHNKGVRVGPKRPRSDVSPLVLNDARKPLRLRTNRSP